MGERLGVSAGTVKRHVENILAKTGFQTRTELAAEAGRLGIVIR
ncbi:MAG: LuxR C-terminal-related transcriptional regulator [Lachnospiraceae bacterium]|nr:LuxR C-terminal-related transcriptional regulator [Lachnospiraceae bacterium]